MPIIDRFAERILAAFPVEEGLSRGDAYAEATALLCAMEAIAETDPVHVEEGRIGARRLAEATARLIARSVGARIFSPGKVNGKSVRKAASRKQA